MDLDVKVIPGYAKAPTLYGPGIYCLCFRSSIEDEAEWKLIYIGSFLGTDLNIFSGNAAARRWWTHLASITMRGNSVSIGRRVLRQLVNHYPMDPIVGALQVSSIKGIAKAGGKTIHDDQGCVSSRNRTKFAIAFQHCFHGIMLPSSILEHFKFIYVQIDRNALPSGLYGKNSALASHIVKAEKDLIDRLVPLCNKGNLSSLKLNQIILNNKLIQSEPSCFSARDEIRRKILEIEKSPDLTEKNVKLGKKIEGQAIYAIGDVHGQYELLKLLYEKLDILLSELTPGSTALLIHLGDLMDRGPDSILCLKAALNWNHEECESIVLPGNHEQMLMGFWDSVSNRRPINIQQKLLDLWLQNGGDAVCKELNVDDNEDIDEVILALERAGVPMMLKELSAAPAAVRAGQYLFVHAGIPCKPNTAGREFMHPDDVPAMDWRLENINAPGFEERSSPLWVREPFLDYPVSWPDNVIVVHGHTITIDGPDIRHNRIGIDTGTCMDGSLTMLEINSGEIMFHSAKKRQT